MLTLASLALEFDMILFLDCPSSVTQLNGNEESSDSTVTQLDGEASTPQNRTHDLTTKQTRRNFDHERNRKDTNSFIRREADANANARTRVRTRTQQHKKIARGTCRAS